MKSFLKIFPILFLSAFLISCGARKRQYSNTSEVVETQSDTMVKKDVAVSSNETQNSKLESEKRTSEKTADSIVETTTQTNVRLNPGATYTETDGKNVKTYKMNGDGSVDINTTTKTTASNKSIEKKEGIATASIRENKKDSTYTEASQNKGTKKIKKAAAAQSGSIRTGTLFGIGYTIWTWAIIIIFIALIFLWPRIKRALLTIRNTKDTIS